MSGLERPPRIPYRKLADGTKNQRTGGALLFQNAAPIPEVTAAASQALASVAGVSEVKFHNDDIYDLPADGAQSVALSFLPIDGSLHVELNGVKLDKRTEWSLNGQTLSILTDAGALTDDVVTTEYAYLAGQPQLVNDPVVAEGLILWLRASDITQADNTDISTWQDQSGYDNDATGTGDSGAKPKYRTAQTPNGGPAVYVDSTSSHRHFSFADFLTGQTEAEVFLVVRVVNNPALDADPRSNGLWKFGSASGSGVESNHYPWSDNGVYMDFGSTTRHSVYPSPVPDYDEWHILNISAASGYWEMRLNTTVLLTTTTNTVGWHSGGPVLGISEKFATLDQTGQFYFAEMRIYDAVLDSTQRSDVRDSLAATYGITL